MKNNNSKIKEISNHIFNKNIIGKRNSDILVRYLLKSYKKETMQSLGDFYGVSKEAIRITLKNSLEQSSKEAMFLLKDIDRLAQYLNTVQLSTLEELTVFLSNNGFYCENNEEAALAVAIANEFSSIEHDFRIHRFGDSEQCNHIFSSGDAADKILSKAKLVSVKKIKKDGGSHIDTIMEVVKSLPLEITPSKKVVKAFLNPSSSNDIKSTDNEFYFHTRRNKILSRVLKAASVFESASPTLLTEAINQSVQHRCKDATRLTEHDLICMISEFGIGSVENHKIKFIAKDPESDFYSGEMEIVERLKLEPGMELPDIENEIASLGLSKASVFQLCSISPLIAKQGRKYFSVN